MMHLSLRRTLPLLLIALGAEGCSSESRASEPPAKATSQAAAAPETSAASETSASSNVSPVARSSAAPSAAPVAVEQKKRPEDEPGDRIYAKGRFVWIQPAPRQSQGWLGYLALGGSVRLFEGSAEKAKTIGSGCEAWYRVEPAGYVCADDAATLDKNDPVYVALQYDRSDITSPYPYGYAESLGSPRYEHTPNAAEQRHSEWDLEAHNAKLEVLRQALAGGDTSKVDKDILGIDLSPAGQADVSPIHFGGLVQEARSYVPPLSTVAWSRQFDEGGRTWLVTADHMIMPKDRTRPYPRTTFQGVTLTDQIQLPIAWIRRKDAAVFKRSANGELTATGEKVERLQWFMVGGDAVTVGGKTYIPSKQDTWVLNDEDNVTVAAQSKEIPYQKNENVGKRRSWLDISVLGGTLVAYEDDKPVFTTMIAPGRGGVPFPGKDPVDTASTPTGTWRVDGKFKTATMINGDIGMVHAEVQYVQNFHGPHALHGAYWHNGWGELKSGGCVNLAPIDAQFMFGWTDPQIPKDWYGMRSDESFGPPTRVLVRK